MFCPKGKCGCQYYILLTLKKKFMDTGSWIFFNKKLILDYYFCLKSGPVFLFQIFIIVLILLIRATSGSEIRFAVDLISKPDCIHTYSGLDHMYRRMWYEMTTPPFLNFLFMYLFSIKFLYYLISFSLI